MPAPPLVITDTARLRLLWANGGTLYAINVLGVMKPAGVSVTQALTNTLDTAIKSALTSSTLAVALSPQITLVAIGLRSLSAANQPEFVGAGAPQPGAAATETAALPPQVALCVTLRTLLAGRRFRGRVYVPGFAELQNSPGGIAAGTGGAVNFVTAIKSALVSNGMDLGVISVPNDQLVPPKPGFITQVTSVVARDAVWDTQRRRAYPGV